MTDDRDIVVHDPTTHPMESYWAKRGGAMTDSRGLREALALIRRAASSEASRPYAEDGHIIGPDGLTVADWRAINAALYDLPYAANPAPAGLTSTDQLEAEQRGQPIPFANPAPAGLDVERLAMAMNKVSGILANDWAVRVATEYARLGSAAEEEG
jgi:hypothetical protein